MSYRQFVPRSLNRSALSEKNRNAPENHRFCNAFCFDYLPTDRFSGIHVICNNCRSTVWLAEKRIKEGQTTAEKIRNNPMIVFPHSEDGLHAHKTCETCSQTKQVTNFEHGRRVCKTCRYLKLSAKNKEEVRGFIHDIEELKDNPQRLEAYLNNIAKNCLTLIVSHYQIGRKVTDKKTDLVLNVLNHFRQLMDPSRCRSCGQNKNTDTMTCLTCQTRMPRLNERRKEFTDSLDTTFEELEPMDPETEMDRFTKDEMTMLGRKAGLKFEHIIRKQDLFGLLNAFLVERRARRDEERAKKELKDKGIEVRLSFPELVVDEFRIQARASDGYINATQLCKAGGKLFANWYQLDSTKAYLQVVSEQTEIPITPDIGNPITGKSNSSCLIHIVKGGNDRGAQGSWIHPDVATQLAQWISPLFAFKVSHWVREILTTGHASIDPKTNEDLIRLQIELQREQTERKRIETNHKRLLYKREYHKFKKGPCFYIVRTGEDVYKIGFDGIDINERFRAYRTSIPQMRVCYMVFSPDAGLIEKCMLMRYKSFRVENNHEFIENISLLELTGSVDTLIRFCRIPHEMVSNEEIDLYNGS